MFPLTVEALVVVDDRPVVFHCRMDCEYFNSWSCLLGPSVAECSDLRPNKQCPLFMLKEESRGDVSTCWSPSHCQEVGE